MSLDADVAHFLKSGGKVTQVPQGVIVWEKGKPLRMSIEDQKASDQHDKSIPYRLLHYDDRPGPFSRR